MLIFFRSGEDKDKVRQAIKDKTVHSAVARSTAPTSSSSQAIGKKKRKPSFVEPSFVSTPATTSRAVTDAPAPRVPNAIYPPTASQVIEVGEEAEVDNQEEEEPPERLYATLSTSIVGIQYYKGDVDRVIGCMHNANALGRPCRVWRTGEARSGTT